MSWKQYPTQRGSPPVRLPIIPSAGYCSEVSRLPQFFQRFPGKFLEKPDFAVTAGKKHWLSIIALKTISKIFPVKSAYYSRTKRIEQYRERFYPEHRAYSIRPPHLFFFLIGDVPMTFLLAEATELRLEISPTLSDQAWQQSRPYSTASRRWSAYLNQLCLDTVVPWLEEDHDCRVQSSTLPQNLWELVEGTVITLRDGTRLILIPSETIDTDEFRVPQEWVDIPSWIGDYYLAVQVNPDEQSVRVWGYTTHARLKTRGCYNWRDRSYSLDADELIADINVLWVARQLCLQEETRSAVEPLSGLSAAQAENLVQRLSHPDVLVPRLAVPFELWGALLEYNQAQPLCRQLQGQETNNLSRWLENWFAGGWQSVEDLFPTSQSLAFSFRRTLEVPEREVQRIKQIPLGNLEAPNNVVLLVGLSTESDSRIGVRIQLHPQPNNSYLPAQARLTLRSESGEVLRSVEARTQDNYIQIPRFKCMPGFRFSVEIALEDTTVTEYFQV